MRFKKGIKYLEYIASELLRCMLLYKSPIHNRCRMFILRMTNVDSVKGTAGRLYYEYEILASLRKKHAKICLLSIGTTKYTKHYYQFFALPNIYKTIDNDHEIIKHTKEGYHINDTVLHLDKYFEQASIDVILFNGVYGWGIDHEDELKLAVDKIYNHLKTEGILIFGWNDNQERDPIGIRNKAIFSKFVPFAINKRGEVAFSGSRDNQVFWYFQKPMPSVSLWPSSPL